VLSPSHRNIFPGALEHVRGWANGRLEARSKAVHSSQALCVSVFGSLASSAKRASFLVDAFEAAGIAPHPVGEPSIECEVRDRRDILNEYGSRNPTCPDVLIRWPGVVLTIESKFTEHLGGCSQARTSRIKVNGRYRILPAACTGNHEPGSDLRTGTGAACRLTVPEGSRTSRRYWEVGATLFSSAVITGAALPCPFRDGHYQLMRNLCFAAALAEVEGLHGFAMLLAFVGASPAAIETRSVFAAFQTLLLPEIKPRVGIISYEQLAKIAREHSEYELADWIIERIEKGIASASAGQRHRHSAPSE
jgi:hypothetical protein